MKKLKKLIIFLLILAMGIIQIPIIGSAETVDEGMCGNEVSWVLDNKGTLTITGSGAITENPWADYSLLIKNIVIEEGITSISVSFRDYGAIKSLSLPDGLVRIGAQAFYGCVSLKSIDIPDTVTTIENYAFAGCNGLTEVTIPASVVNWNWGAFYSCKSLQKAVFEEGALTVPKSIFEYCSNLQEVCLPESITKIETEAFAYSSLPSVQIPSKLTEIGDMAFYSCESLKSVHIKDLNAWCNIYFIHGWSSGGNPLTWGDATLYVNGEPVTDLNIPDSITNINDYAFYGCDSLKSVTIPGTTKVGRNAFEYCENLEKVTFKDGIMVINEETFKRCSKLESVSIPVSIITIAKNAFYGTENLKTVEYPGTKQEWDEITILEGNETLLSAYEHKHNYVLSRTVGATCTKTGKKIYTCTGCQDSYEEEIPVLGHKEEVVSGKPATCTQTGLTEGMKCSVCNEILVAQNEISTIPHTPGEWEVVIAAQIGAEGKEQQKCTVCGAVVDQRVIPAITIEFVPGDANGDGKISAADARIVLRISAKLDNIENYNLPLEALDVTGDGKLTAADARKVLRVSAKLE